MEDDDSSGFDSAVSSSQECGAGLSLIKPFTSVIYKYSSSARVFVPGNPFLPSLMFVR